ncbi:MAG TPA: NADH-quinone oxidoreductase subunit N [Bacteroidia bacterium]|nr:NADH-quinone oxidoreductase subunit N [Bacteroidia bacterium]HRH08096.1 NADH-quinone oxidoreductase subunit N [Bacteroidia bacterium]HRH62267.1 NADH-quinone oxidoreductase subunit N [Bacteroidia bacterium]
MKSLLLLSGIGVISLLAEIFNFKKRLFPIVILSLLAVIAASIKDWNTNIHYYNEMMVFDNFAISFTVLICVVSILWFFMSKDYFTNETNITDHTALVIFSLVGTLCMVSYNNMVMLFLGIEILSLSLYVLAGSKKNDLRSNEAAIKYFLMGSFATGFLLFGIALIYGTTGSFHLHKITQFIQSNVENLPVMFTAGVLMILVGLSFKIAAVPFHFWAPDVYQGSPISITAFMSTVVKTAAFAAFFRLFATSFSQISSSWNDSLGIICAITLLVGNVTAAYQTSVKRLLAFSSIAHAGYMLIALLSLSKIAASSILFYASAYSVASIASFTVLYSILRTKEDAIESFNGLNKRNPFLAFVMTLALLSLAGIPPLAGFFAKYYIFTAAVETNYTWLVLIAVIASLIGIYYYFKLIIAMYFKQDKSNQAIEVSLTHQLILVVAFVLMLVLGIAPGWLIQLI